MDSKDAISGLTQANKSGSGSDKDFNEMVVEVQVTVAYTGSSGLVNGDAYFLLNPLVNGAEHNLQLVVSKFVSDNISGSCTLIDGDTSKSICGNGKDRVVYSKNTDLFEAGAPARYANSTSHTFGPNSKVLKISGFGATGLNVNDGLADIVQKTFSLKNLTLSTEIDSDTTVDGAHASIVMASGFGVAKEKSNFFDAFIGSENTASVDGIPINLCQLGSADFATNNCANKIAKFLRTSDDAYFSGRNDLNRPDISGNKKFEVARVNSIDGGGNFGFNSANRFNLSGGDLSSFWTESFIDSGNTTHGYGQIRGQRNKLCHFINISCGGGSSGGTCSAQAGSNTCCKLDADCSDPDEVCMVDSNDVDGGGVASQAGQCVSKGDASYDSYVCADQACANKRNSCSGVLSVTSSNIVGSFAGSVSCSGGGSLLANGQSCSDGSQCTSNFCDFTNGSVCASAPPPLVSYCEQSSCVKISDGSIQAHLSNANSCRNDGAICQYTNQIDPGTGNLRVASNVTDSYSCTEGRCEDSSGNQIDGFYGDQFDCENKSVCNIGGSIRNGFCRKSYYNQSDCTSAGFYWDSMDWSCYSDEDEANCGGYFRTYSFLFFQLYLWWSRRIDSTWWLHLG